MTRTRIAPRLVAAAVGAAVGALLLAAMLPAAVAAAAPMDPTAFHMRARASLPPTQGGGATSFAVVGGQCFDDPTGDTVLLSEEAPTPAAFGPADIVQHCGGFGQTLTLAVTLAEPTDPLVDVAWEGLTFITWALDTDDDQVSEFVVTYRVNPSGDLVAEVNDVRGDEAVVACAASAQFENQVYIAEDIPADCLDDPSEVAISPGISFDEDGNGDAEDDDVYFDVAPNEQNFEEEAIPAGGPTGTDRFGGVDRFETSARISQAAFPNGADVVYLAEGAVFADAVSGGSLTDGPILLVPTSGDTPPSVAAEIERVDPDTVIALGGIQAIEEEVLTDAAQGRPTSRIFGANRITTAIGISERSFPNGAEEVYLARADVFADAVVAGVLTAGPVLLVPTCGELPASVSDAIESLDPETVTALGGEEAVCTGILEAAGADPDGGTRGTNRLFGISRIDTAVAISSFEFSSKSADALYLARADIFADAVVGGTLTNGPILLVPSCGDLPTVVGLEVQARDPDTVIALGGVEAVCDDILDEAAAQ